MAINATVTGKAGAGVTITAQTFTGVTLMQVDATNQLVTLFMSDGSFKTISIASASTFTTTISGTTYTVTIS